MARRRAFSRILMNPTHYRLHRLRQQAAEAQRRRRLAVWLEHFERLERTPVRTDTERLAKAEALMLAMDGGRPRRLERMRRALPRASPLGDARGSRSRAPGGLDVLSAPVLRFGFRRVLQHQPFEVGGHAAVLLAGLLSKPFLEFAGHYDGHRGSVWF